MTADTWEATQATRNDQYRDVLRAYAAAVNRTDIDGICALFAEDAEIEDPYGGTRHKIKGLEAIRRFYEMAAPKLTIELKIVTGSGGNAAAMALHARVADTELDNISVATFNEAGKITRYTTYWGPGDRRPAA